jgi:hypothetical protein
MQGPHGQGDGPWETPSGRYRAALNGTGKHQIPQRPPGIPHIEQPPPSRRVARPRRRDAFPIKSRRGFLMLGCIFTIFAVLVCLLSYTVANYIQGLSATSGAVTTANDFLSSLSGPHPNYQQAYNDLGPAITLLYPEQDFQRAAQAADHCFGMITDYREIPNSATVQNNSQSYAYMITRNKPGVKPYQLRLTLQPDQDAANTWKITSYGNSLGPGQPTCS